MIDTERLQRFAPMWTTRKDDYILVPLGDNPDGSTSYAIEDHTTNHGVIIEDDELAAEIERRMLAAGVLVGDPRSVEVRKLLIRRRLQGRER